MTNNVYDYGTYDEGLYDEPLVPTDSLFPSPAIALNYSDVASPTYLSAQANPDDTTLYVQSTSRYPTPPFFISIDAGSVIQEICLVIAMTQTTLNVIRNYDSGGQYLHSVNAPIVHSTTAFDYTVMNHHSFDSATDWHPIYLDAFRHSNSTLHQVGTSIPVDTPTNSAPGDAQAEGAQESSNAVRADHVHGRETLNEIMLNSMVQGTMALINTAATYTLPWLGQTAGSPMVSNPYSGFTSTNISIPTSDYALLQVYPNMTLERHFWTYSPLINPNVVAFQR